MKLTQVWSLLRRSESIFSGWVCSGGLLLSVVLHSSLLRLSAWIMSMVVGMLAAAILRGTQLFWREEKIAKLCYIHAKRHTSHVYCIHANAYTPQTHMCTRTHTHIHRVLPTYIKAYRLNMPSLLKAYRPIHLQTKRSLPISCVFTKQGHRSTGFKLYIHYYCNTV